jgi:hypothetical protein
MSLPKDKWLIERLKYLDKCAAVTKKKMCYASFVTKDGDKVKKHDLGFFTERDLGVAWSRAFQLVPYNPATGFFPAGKIEFSSVIEHK